MNKKIITNHVNPLKENVEGLVVVFGHLEQKKATKLKVKQKFP